MRYWASARITRASTPVSAAGRRLYQYTVGFGYYPLWVLGSLFVLWALASALCFGSVSSFAPKKVDAYSAEVGTPAPDANIGPSMSTYPAFQPALYALDVALPVAATGQLDAWRLLDDNRTLIVVFAIIKAIAWLLTALLLAGLTGLLRRD